MDNLGDTESGNAKSKVKIVTKPAVEKMIMPMSERKLSENNRHAFSMASKCATFIAGMATMGTVAATPTDSLPPKMDMDLSHRNMPLPSSALTDTRLMGIQWDDALAFHKKCGCAPQGTGIERWSLKFMTASKHFGKENDGYINDDWKHVAYNEFNPGIGVEYRLNKIFHATAGGYYNSIRKLSFYAGVGIETNRQKFFGAGIELGGVMGYQKREITPMALPYLRMGRDDHLVNVKIAVLPPIKDMTPGVVTVQARIKLDRIFKR